jgi:hypothetical protein
MLSKLTQGTSRASMIFLATVVFPEALPPQSPVIMTLIYHYCSLSHQGGIKINIEKMISFLKSKFAFRIKKPTIFQKFTFSKYNQKLMADLNTGLMFNCSKFNL